MDTIDGKEFLQCLLNLSEQASNLACLVRQDDKLNELLIASKTQRLNGEPDFKTLADVLIQCTFIHGIKESFPKSKYPTCVINVMGEEDGTFPTRDGKHVHLDVADSMKATCTTLRRVLDDEDIVQKLGHAVHTSVEVHDDMVNQLSGIQIPSKLNLWIDPIDSTKSYIQGDTNLESVTILVGVHYNGEPIIGVVTYPFTKRQVWGVCYLDTKICNIPRPVTNGPIKTVYLSSLESDKNQDKLRSCGYQVDTPAGAGFKLGGVILGDAAFYFVSVSSTYQWDTCGPHAILRALGGDIIQLTNREKPLIYNESRDPHPGFLAYIDRNSALKFLESVV